MPSNTRFVGAGIQPLIDAVKAAGAEPGDLRTIVWQATWARGYDDVVAPAPAIRLKEEGFVIYARSIGHGRFAGIVDTTHALWALIARGPTPPPGARLRIVPAFIDGEIGWDAATIEVLGLGLSIRFGQKIDESNDWIDVLRNVLGQIADVETERRRSIVEKRRAMLSMQPMKSFQAEVDALHEAIRTRIETEDAATPEERHAFDRGNERQRKAIIDEVKKRRAKRYHDEVAALRAKIPELQAAYQRRLQAASDARAAVTELEDSASRSRAISERILVVEHQLNDIEKAGLLVTSDGERLAKLTVTDFAEISNTIELLHDLIPRRAQRQR